MHCGLNWSWKCFFRECAKAGGYYSCGGGERVSHLSQLSSHSKRAWNLRAGAAPFSPYCLPRCCMYRDPAYFYITSQGQLDRSREAAGLLLSLGAFQLGNSSSHEPSPICELPGAGAEQDGSSPWDGCLRVTVQCGTACSACQAAPPGTVEAGDDEILALHPGKFLAVWNVNKMLNLQPLIYCAAC